MSESVGGIHYDLSIDTSKLTKAKREIKGALDEAGSSVESFGGKLSPIAGAVTAAFSVASMTAFISKLVEVQRQFDVLNAGLITATGSTEEASKAFEILKNFAATTPYDLQQVTRAFNQLVNLGLTPSERALTSYGNTAAAMGKDLSQLVEAVADAATGEFERLKEFGIKSKVEGDKVAFTFQNVKTSVGNNAKEIENYLIGLGEQKFGDAMANRAATLDGAVSNLADTWGMLFLTISQSGIGEAISDMTRVAINVLGNLQDTIENDTKQSVIGLDKESETLRRNNNIAIWSAQTIESLAGFADAVQIVWDTVSVLGRNVAYVFKGIGTEIGGIAAQAVALAKGDLAGASAIGDMMKSDAAARRAEVDAADSKTLAAKKRWGDKMLEASERIKKGTSTADSSGDRLAKYGKGGGVISPSAAEDKARKRALDAELRDAKRAAEDWQKWKERQVAEDIEKDKKYREEQADLANEEALNQLKAEQDRADLKAKVRGFDPLTSLKDEYDSKMALVLQYETEMAQIGVDVATEANAAKLAIDQEYTTAKDALMLESWAKQSEVNQFTLDALDAFASASTSAISGLLTGTMTASDAMKNLASSILNEAVGALTQMGLQYVKNMIIQQTADKARQTAGAAAMTASASGQVAMMSSMAAMNAFAATAAIPMVGPTLAPAAAAAAGAAAGALGAPSIAAAPIAGARRYGGAVSAGSMYQVNEGGMPEMFTASNGNQYMMATANGSVTPSGELGGGGGIQININNFAGADIQTSTSSDGKIIEIAVKKSLEAVGASFSSNTGAPWDGLKAGSNTQSKL